MLKGKPDVIVRLPSERVRKCADLWDRDPREGRRLPSSNRFHTVAARPTGVEIATSPSLTWKGLSLLVTRDSSHVMGASACHDGRGGSWARRFHFGIQLWLGFHSPELSCNAY
jgi:hypothetical protein